MAKKVAENPHEPIPSTEDHQRDYPIRKRVLDPQGREIVSPLPMDPPIGYSRSEPLALQIRRMVMSEHLRIAAEQAGVETFEEADDFEVGDDYEPSSPWENDYDPPISELTQAGLAELQRKQANNPPSIPNPPANTPPAPPAALDKEAEPA